jgi:hypothetical protein
VQAVRDVHDTASSEVLSGAVSGAGASDQPLAWRISASGDEV